MKSLRYISALALVVLCATAQANSIVGPVVEGKKAGSTELRYLPFSNTDGDPVIATEAFVNAQIAAIPASSDKPLTIYKTTGGEGYDDSRLPDVLWVDGSQDFDITATLQLTSSEYRRFWFVNLSQNHEIHVYQGGSNAYKVGGPMSTALILANKDSFYVLSNAPAYVPAPIPMP